MVRNLRIRLRHLISDGRGTTTIEYALIAAIISLAIVVSINSVGNPVAGFFSSAASELDKANSAAP